MHFDKHKLQEEVERLKRSGEMARELKRYRDRFLVSHRMDAPAAEAITAKDLEREASALKLADIADQARLMAMKERGTLKVVVDRANETLLDAATRLTSELDARRNREGR